MGLLDSLGIKVTDDKVKEVTPVKITAPSTKAVPTPVYAPPTPTPMSPINSLNTTSIPSHLPNLAEPMNFEQKITDNTFDKDSAFGKFMKVYATLVGLPIDEASKITTALANLNAMANLTKEQVVADLTARISQLDADTPDYQAQLESVKAASIGKKETAIKEISNSITVDETTIKDLEEKIRAAKTSRSGLEAEVESGTKHFQQRVNELAEALNKIKTNLQTMRNKLG